MIKERYNWRSPLWLPIFVLPIVFLPMVSLPNFRLGGYLTAPIILLLTYATNRRIRFRAGLCDRHFRMRRLSQFVFSVLTILLAASIFTVIDPRSVIRSHLSNYNVDLIQTRAAILAATSAVAMAICYGSGMRLFSVERIHRDRAWFKWAGAKFLDSLPPL